MVCDMYDNCIWLYKMSESFNRKLVCKRPYLDDAYRVYEHVRVGKAKSYTNAVFDGVDRFIEVYWCAGFKSYYLIDGLVYDNQDAFIQRCDLPVKVARFLDYFIGEL